MSPQTGFVASLRVADTGTFGCPGHATNAARRTCQAKSRGTASTSLIVSAPKGFDVFGIKAKDLASGALRRQTLMREPVQPVTFDAAGVVRWYGVNVAQLARVHALQLGVAPAHVLGPADFPVATASTVSLEIHVTLHDFVTGNCSGER